MIKYEEYKLGDVCSRFSSGKGIHSEKIFEEGDFLVYGGNGIRGYTSTKNFSGQCAIIGRQGAYCGNVKYFEGDAYMTEHAIVAVAKEEHNSRYLAYVLDGLKLNRLSGQAAQPGLSVKKLAKITIKMPDKKYQNKVAAVLSEYEKNIENNNKRIKILEQMAENLYKEWFVRFRFPGHEDVEFENGIPKGWEVEQFGNVCSIDRGLSYSSEEIECEEGVDLINLKNILSFGGFRYDGTKKYSGVYKESHVVDRGDLIMGVTDMTQDRRTVGSVAIVPTTHSISVISADLIRIKANIDNIFLYCMFKYGGVSKYLSQFANGANVLHLRPQAVEKLKISIASSNVIEEFVDVVKCLFDEIDLLHEKNKIITKQRDLLLPRLMSGKLEIK